MTSLSCEVLLSQSASRNFEDKASKLTTAIMNFSDLSSVNQRSGVCAWVCVCIVCVCVHVCVCVDYLHVVLVIVTVDIHILRGVYVNVIQCVNQCMVHVAAFSRCPTRPPLYFTGLIMALPYSVM